MQAAEIIAAKNTESGRKATDSVGSNPTAQSVINDLEGSMDFQVGDVVEVQESAREDVGTVAWQFVQHNPVAVVKGWQERPAVGTKANNEVVYLPRDRDYAVEWSIDFRGGHNCLGCTAERRGHWIGGQHLELCFEASRTVNTVPNIKPQWEHLSDTMTWKMFEDADAKDTKENNL